MTQPVIPNATITYLDTQNVTRTAQVPVNAIQIANLGIVYTDYSPGTPPYTDYFFPWGRILEVASPQSSITWVAYG